MTVPLHQVDAFTSAPFTGNPAAVCLLDEPAAEDWMQAVATEMNLSETAFLHPRKDGGHRLRWFTPADEVDLCGHATLASAHVLWKAGVVAEDEPVRFHTNSGVLTCRRQGSWTAMDFPATPPWSIEAPAGLAQALGEDPSWAATNDLDLLVELRDEPQVRGLDPDLEALSDLPYRGIIVTAPADRAATEHGADFVSRFFAPRLGVPEDPVTGSAHCTLGPVWASRLEKQEVTGHQVSSRPGTVRVRIQSGARVELVGQAVTVLEGELLAP